MDGGIGLQIKVGLDDREAKQKVAELLKNDRLTLQFDNTSLTQIKNQMTELSKIKFESLIVDDSLKQVEQLTTELTKQLEVARELKKIYAGIGVPSEVTNAKEQDKLYKQASKLQTQISKEQEKIIGLTGQELKERQELLKGMTQTLNVTKSQITDQEKLNKLENERQILENNRKAKALDQTKKQETTQLNEQIKKTNELANVEKVAYQTINKLNSEIYNLKIKQVTASETEQQRLAQQIASLETMKQQMYDMANAQDGSTNRQAELKAVTDITKARLEEFRLEEKLASAKAKKVQADEKDKANAKTLVELAQKQYDIKLKNLQAGRNGQYVDTTQLQAFKTALANLDSTSTANAQAQLRQLAVQFRELTSNANISRLQQLRTSLSSLGNTFSVVTQYFSAAMVVNQFFTAMRDGIQDIKDLDTAMTTLRITMEEFTEADISNLVEQSKQLSKELKINVSEVLESVKTVANANESMESIINKSKPAIILSNLTGLDTGTTVEMIQGALQQFEALKDGSEESAMKVADSMTSISKSLSMDFATGVQGMAESISIVGSLADQVGMDIDETLSMVSSLAETTRLSFSEIANGLKSIIARTMRVKTPELGIDESDFLKTEKALHSVGVSIRNLTTGEMRDFRDIVLDLNGKWETLDDTAKSYVADAMGGAQRLSMVFAMLSATDRSEELLAVAQSGTGAAIKAQEEYAQSLEAKFTELANASTLFWQSFFNIEVVSAGVDLLVGFINTMTTLVDTFGTVPTTMAVVSSSLLLFNKNLRGLGTSIVSTLIPSIGNLNKSLTNHSNASKISIAMLQSERAEILSTITAKKAMGVSTKSDTALLMTNTLQLGLNTAGLIANKVAVVALQAAMSMGLSLAITAVTTALTSMIGGMGQASKKAAELAEETKSAYEELRSGLESNADGNALIKQYEELSATIEDLNSKVKDNTIPTDELTTAKEKLTEAQTALKDVQEQLIQLYPQASKSIDEQGNLIFGQIEDYKNLTQAEREYYDQKLKYLEMEAKANRSSVEAQIAENEEKMKDHQWRYEQHMDSQSKYEYGSEWYNEFGSMASEEAKKLQELAEETQKLRDQLETYDSVIEQANNSQHELIDSTNQLTDAKNEQAQANDNLIASEETAEERASRLASENKEAAKSYLNLTEDIQQAEEWLDKISDKTFDMSDAQSMLDMFDGFVGDITDITDVQSFLNDKIKEMATSQAEAYAEMKSQDEEFWATKYKNSDDWLNYVDAVEKDIVDIVSSSLGEQGTDFVNHINQLGGFRDVDLSNVKNLADAKGKVESSLVEELKRMWSEYYNAQASVIRESVRQDIIKNNPRASIAQAAAMEKEALKELNAQNEKVTNLLNNINTTVKPTYTGGSGQSYIGKKPTSSSSSSSSSKNKEVADLELTIDRYFKLNNAVDDYTNALKRNQRLQATASPEKKIKLMKEEITLYQKQQKAVKALLNEQKKEAEELKKQLAKKGFTFESDGDLKNYSTRLKQLVKSANAKKGSAKETAIEEVKNIESIIKAYNTLINDTIPDTEDSYLELSESIKEAQRSQLEYVSDIQNQITDALKEELQKRHDETRKALEREKELYLSQYEEEDYNTQLSEQQRKIDEINQQIINLSRDTSLAGQLKLEQLMLEYEEQVEAMNQMIRDKEKENGSNAFDNMLNELDEKLEESLDEKALANMVNQALTQGFIALDGEIISTENLLTQMLERSGEAFTALGQTLRDELIEGLEVAKGLITEIGGLSFNGKSVSSITTTSNSRSVQDYGLTTASVNSRSLSTLSASQMAQTIQVTFDKLLNVEGNFDSALLSDVERMISVAKDEVTYAISRALSTY